MGTTGRAGLGAADILASRWPQRQQASPGGMVVACGWSVTALKRRSQVPRAAGHTAACTPSQKGLFLIGQHTHLPLAPPGIRHPSPSSFNFKILRSPSLPRESRDLQPSVRNPEAEGTLRAPPFTEGSLKIGLPNTVRSSLSPPLYGSVNRGSKTNNFSKRGPV